MSDMLDTIYGVAARQPDERVRRLISDVAKRYGYARALLEEAGSIAYAMLDSAGETVTHPYTSPTMGVDFVYFAEELHRVRAASDKALDELVRAVMALDRAKKESIESHKKGYDAKTI